MRRIIGSIMVSLMALALVFALVGAGVVAWFSDTETSIGNVFTAGTLNLLLTDNLDDGSEGETATWVFVNIAPGASGGGARLTLRNIGTLPGFIDLSGIIVTNTEGVNPESETGVIGLLGELGANLLVQIWLDADNDGVVDVDVNDNLVERSIHPAAAIGASNPGVTGVLNAIANSYDLNAPLAAGGFAYIALRWTLPDTVGNAVQGDEATLDFIVELAQTAGQ